MRAFATSSARPTVLVQRWVTPGAVGLVIATSGMSSVPSTALTTPATLPLRMQWAQGYSGCVGVSPSGCQVASRSVAGLPSISPLRIAVTGRQKLKWYLASNTAINASLIAIPPSAHKSSALDDIHLLGNRELPQEGVIRYRSRHEPEAGSLRLLGRSLRALL